MTRQELKQQHAEKMRQLEILQSEIIENRIQQLKLCDDEQWFTETVKEVMIARRPKQTEKRLMGTIHWNEIITDQSTGESLTFERHQIVSTDGVFYDLIVHSEEWYKK